MEAKRPIVLCMDLEGVLVPEVWIEFAKETGIDDFKLTTRDVNDYDKLMKMRIKKLKEENLTLKDVQKVIGRLEPLEGAKEYVEWAKSNAPFIILSDTFYEFAAPLMEKLGNPTLFCNNLVVDEKGMIVDYVLRQDDGKRKAILALRQIGFETISVGDSYNDTTMLKEADTGFLFHSPDNIKEQFPQFKAYDEYEELKEAITKVLNKA